MSAPARLAVIWLLAFGPSLARSLVDGFGAVDEAWFLRVIDRVRSGDVLYRDVFFGATPLSVYLTAALMRLTGIEVVAVKLVTNACFAAAAALACGIAWQVGLARGVPFTLVGALLVLGRPYANPPYTPLASMFLLATCSMAIAGVHRSGRPSITSSRRALAIDLLTGTFAGMSFDAKQNVGLLALGAAVAAIALTGGRTAPSGSNLRRSAVVVLGFCVSAGVVLLPVAASGGLGGLWEYGFGAKAAYVRHGGVPYLSELGGLLKEVRGLPSLAAALSLLHGGVLLLPFLAASLTVYLLWKRRLTSAAMVLALFAAASVASAFPRWDRFHLSYALPGLALLVAYGLGELGPHPGWRVAARASKAVVAAAVLLLFVAYPVSSLTVSGYRPSTLPHFRGPLIRPQEQEQFRSAGARLAEAAGGKPLFLLSARAGFLYLVSGVRNPTPFDIPAVTAVGRLGVPWLLSEFASGRIGGVCIDDRVRGPMWLDDVEAFVKAHFQRERDLGVCTLYRHATQPH